MAPMLNLLNATSAEGMGDLASKLLKMNAAGLMKLADNSVQLYFVTASVDDIVWVPPGWFLCEAATANDPLIYGVRKSIFPKMSTGRMKAQFMALIEVMERDSRDTSQMRSIAELM